MAMKKPAAKKEAPTEQMILFTFRVTPTLKKDLELIAKKRATTPAAVIRTAMESYVKNTKKLGRV